MRGSENARGPEDFVDYSIDEILGDPEVVIPVGWDSNDFDYLEGKIEDEVELEIDPETDLTSLFV